MRKSTIHVLMFAAILFSGSVLISACGSGQKTESTEEPAAESSEPAEEPISGEETAYACPMHPEITGKEGDSCSKCGMDLEAVTETKADSSEVSED
jgi:hypothetical protein